MTKKCIWQQDDTGDDSGTYFADCGSNFSLNEGTPTDNRMKFCCYCGGEIVEMLVNNDDEAA